MDAERCALPDGLRSLIVLLCSEPTLTELAVTQWWCRNLQEAHPGLTTKVVSDVPGRAGAGSRDPVAWQDLGELEASIGRADLVVVRGEIECGHSFDSTRLLTPEHVGVERLGSVRLLAPGVRWLSNEVIFTDWPTETERAFLNRIVGQLEVFSCGDWFTRSVAERYLGIEQVKIEGLVALQAGKICLEAMEAESWGTSIGDQASLFLEGERSSALPIEWILPLLERLGGDQAQSVIMGAQEAMRSAESHGDSTTAVGLPHRPLRLRSRDPVANVVKSMVSIGQLRSIGLIGLGAGHEVAHYGSGSGSDCGSIVINSECDPAVRAAVRDWMEWTGIEWEWLAPHSWLNEEVDGVESMISQGRVAISRDPYTEAVEVALAARGSECTALKQELSGLREEADRRDIRMSKLEARIEYLGRRVHLLRNRKALRFADGIGAVARGGWKEAADQFKGDVNTPIIRPSETRQDRPERSALAAAGPSLWSGSLPLDRAVAAKRLSFAGGLSGDTETLRPKIALCGSSLLRLLLSVRYSVSPLLQEEKRVQRPDCAIIEVNGRELAGSIGPGKLAEMRERTLRTLGREGIPRILWITSTSRSFHNIDHSVMREFDHVIAADPGVWRDVVTVDEAFPPVCEPTLTNLQAVREVPITTPALIMPDGEDVWSGWEDIDEPLAGLVRGLESVRIYVSQFDSCQTRSAGARGRELSCVEQLAVAVSHPVVIAPVQFDVGRGRDLSTLAPSIVASGGHLVTYQGKELVEQLGATAVHSVGSAEEGIDTVRSLMEDEERRYRSSLLSARMAMTKHSAQARIGRILSVCSGGDGDFEAERARVSIICSTNKVGSTQSIIESAATQTYSELELVLVYHGVDVNATRVRKQASESGIDHVEIIQAPETWSLGRCLNAAVQRSSGDVISKFDDDNYYAPAFIEDLVLGRSFTRAPIVGKLTHHVWLEGRGLLLVRFPGYEHKFVNFVSGSAFLAERSVFDEFGFGDRTGGEDTDFFRAAKRHQVVVYSVDRFNYIYNRRASSSGHTWQVAEENFLGQSTIEVYGNCPRHVVV